jgi:hypothetical protein
MFRMMKKNIYKTLMGLAFVMLSLSGCKDGFYDDYSAQAVDNHGKGQNTMISTAVTSSGQDEFYVNAVDGVETELEVNLIPVVISGAGLAKQDIHVKLVVNQDSLDTYNEVNETDYVLAGSDGSPAFTLLDDGVVTIKKGTEVGYLKAKLIPSAYFGSTAYAFSYKIESVQEPGYTISGNHNFGIVVVLPKNQWDGAYTLNIQTSGWGAYGISDISGADKGTDWGNINLATTGQYSVGFSAASDNAATGNGQVAFLAGETSKTSFGAANPNFTFDPVTNTLVSMFNSNQDGRHRDFKPNPAAPADHNVVDPVTHNVTFDYIMSQDGRPDQYIVAKMTYKGPR